MAQETQENGVAALQSLTFWSDESRVLFILWSCENRFTFYLPKLLWIGHEIKLATHSLFMSILELKLSEASRASWNLQWRWWMYFFFLGCTLWPRLLCATQHTRWDSSAHTVTQAFRHSLAPTNTISVTFHYMVLGWISGLETHQISTQRALPPHAQYCLSATMSNCFLFALSCL